MPSPITLSGSIPVTNASGITISAATADVINSYTAGADFTFTNDGVLFNSYDDTHGILGATSGSLTAGIFLVAGNSTAGSPGNRVTNAGTIIGGNYHYGIDVIAHSGPTNPVLITNTGSILIENTVGAPFGIYVGPNVVATVTNSGDIVAENGVSLQDTSGATEVVSNLAGATIVSTDGFGSCVDIADGHNGTLGGTGIIANYGVIGGYINDNVLNPTIINGGTIENRAFTDGAGTLVVDPGAVFAGGVYFGNESASFNNTSLLSTILLAGTGFGTLANPASYYGFGALTIAAGADWTLGNTSSNTGITGITTISELGTLNVGGDIAGVTLLAGAHAAIGFTGLNAGNDYAGAGTYALNPVSGLTMGDSIILGPGVLNTAEVTSQAENDATGLGQAYEFIENNGDAVFVPYSGTQAEPLTAQNVTLTTHGSEVTLSFGEGAPAAPITLVGSTPTLNPAGITISAASADVSNNYTAGAVFTFTNAGLLINTYFVPLDNPGGLDGGKASGIDLIAGNTTAGSPVNLITNTGTIIGYHYNLGINVEAQAGLTNPVLIQNTGAILNTNTTVGGYGIYTGRFVAGTITNSGEILAPTGVEMLGGSDGTEVAINLAGGTIATSARYGEAVLIFSGRTGTLGGAGIVVNYGGIAGAVYDSARNVTIVNGGTINGRIDARGTGTLVVDPGAVFGSRVQFYNNTASYTPGTLPSTIVLAGTGAGSLAQPANYFGFGALTIAAGASWSLGNNYSSAGIANITTISDLGTLNVGGDIAGVTLAAGPDAAIAFTGLNTGNSFAGAGTYATNPVTGLTYGDSIILGSGVLNIANVVSQGENDATSLGQAYEFIESGGQALFVPYGATADGKLTAQNLTVTTQGSAVTLAFGAPVPGNPITLVGSTPATNPVGTVISAATTDVTNSYTAGADFTFTNAGVLINTNQSLFGANAGIDLVAGNTTAGMPDNLITNTGTIYSYIYGIDVIAQQGQTNPVLINNSGTVTATGTFFGEGINVGENVAATVTNSGDITGDTGVELEGRFNGTEVAINLAGGTIATLGNGGDYGVQLITTNETVLAGTGIVVNYGLIAGQVGEYSYNATLINGGTITGLAAAQGSGILALAPGAVFEQGVDFYNRTIARGAINAQGLSTILLGGAGFGTLANPASYTGFGALTIAAGADWTLGNTSSSAGITGITTITDLGTLDVRGDIAGVTLLAGPDAVIGFTGLNAGNTLSGFGPGVYATNPVTGLTVGDSVILGPGVLNAANVVEQIESDGTTLGQAYEFVETGGQALYLPYSGTADAPLTEQNLLVSTFGGEVTITIVEAYVTFTGNGDSTLAANYAGDAAPSATLSPAQALIVASFTDTISSAAPLTNNSAITITNGALLDTTEIDGAGAITLENSGTLILANTLGADSGQSIVFGSGGSALALNTLELSGSAAGFGGAIAGFGANDAILLSGAVLPTLGLGGTVSLSYAGSLLTVAELNASGTVTASTTLDVGTNYLASAFSETSSTAGLVIESTGTIAPPAPITLVGSIPATNPVGVTISAPGQDVTNSYTAGAAFTFTNAGALINTVLNPSYPGAAIYLIAGNTIAGMPANFISNTGSINAYSYGIGVTAPFGQTSPVLINNTGTIVSTAAPNSYYGVGIITGPNVAATVTNSGDITGDYGVVLNGRSNFTEIVTNLAGGTIDSTYTGGVAQAILIIQYPSGTLGGTGIVVNDGLIAGAVKDEALSATIVNGGTFTGAAYAEGSGILALAPGAVFGGAVAFYNKNAGGTINAQPLSTILLGGTGAGTLANPANYTGFGALTIAAGADWTLGNTSTSVGITGVTTVSDFGTLNLAGDIAGVTLLAGPDAAIVFTGLNAGNSYGSAGTYATNPLTSLTVGDSIILGTGVLNTANVLSQGENDGTTLGQAYEFTETGGQALYLPYSGTADVPLTAQNLTFTTQGSEVTISVSEIVYTFAGGGTTTSFDDPSNYPGSLAPGNSIAAAEAVLVTAAAALPDVNTLTNDGTIIVSGTAASFLDPTALTGTGTLVIENGGQVTLDDPSDSATNFAFSGDGTLSIDDPLSTAATISNFVPGDSIIFAGLPYVTGASVSSSGTVTTIYDAETTFSLNIFPTGESFHLTSVTGGTALTAIPCFLAGTRIRTDQGEVAVEDLAIGDRVITLSGDAVPVKWLGRRTYRQPYPENSADIIPILICRNALGPNLPKRDLYVSPLHAMYLADVLVPAGLLVNGRSIRACPEMPAVQYVHIELERHDVIFAEGAPSETFVDCDSRAMFENAAEFAALYPEDASPEWRFCAPRLESGPALRRIWSRLAGRAGLTASPGAPPHAKLLGYVDQAGHAGITGWAYLPAHPDEAVELEVLDGQGVIARILADRYRPDLAQAGIGNGRHGFELTFAQPLPENRTHTIRVRRAGGPELARSPISLPARKTAAAPRAAGGKRALVLDALWPDPARDAGSNAILSHIAGLRALGFAVDLMAVQEPGTPPPRGLAGLGIGFLEFPGVEKLLLAHGADYALVYMHRLAVAGPYGALVRSLSPALRVYSVADLHHRRLAGQARIEQDQVLAVRAEQVRAEEFLAMRQADAVITHTAAETEILRQACPGMNVHTVPWAAPVAESVLPFAARHGVVFVGNYRHAPNQDAVRWLLADIMPLVWARKPGVTCRIAGAAWPAAALPVLDPRVTLTGFVPEARELFAQARLSVAPLRFGAGLKGKVLDSLAAGIPCAMTSLAAEGFGLEGADTAEELAALICRLHEDPALNTAIGQQGQALVAARFGQEVMLNGLRAVVGEKVSGRFFEKKLRKKLLLQD